jgi:hypothetical protein
MAVRPVATTRVLIQRSLSVAKCAEKALPSNCCNAVLIAATTDRIAAVSASSACAAGSACRGIVRSTSFGRAVRVIAYSICRDPAIPFRSAVARSGWPRSGANLRTRRSTRKLYPDHLMAQATLGFRGCTGRRQDTLLPFPCDFLAELRPFFCSPTTRDVKASERSTQRDWNRCAAAERSTRSGAGRFVPRIAVELTAL